MNYKVTTTPEFEREVKKILKKHKSIKNDLNVLIEQLEINPTLEQVSVKTSIKFGYLFQVAVKVNPAVLA